MPDNYEQNISVDTPFKPEYEEFINEYKGRGSLKVQTSVAQDAFPIKGVFVDVALIYKGKRYSIYHDVTDASGIVNEIVLPSCLGSDNNSPETAGKSDVTYLISIFHPDFREIIDFPVTIQDRIETILPVALEPLNGGREG